MAQDNQLLVEFLEQLSTLAKQIKEVIETGNVARFTDINRTVKEIYRIEKGGGDEAFALVTEDCEVIYRNFDMLVKVLRTTEDGVIDAGAQKAIDRFLHNMHGAILNIATVFGLI